jgi:hypothetical protein
MVQSILKWVAYFSAIGCFIQSIHFYNEGLLWWPSLMLGVCMIVMGLHQDGEL